MEARDQHKTGNKCTTRRGCAGRGRLHTSRGRDRARASCRQSHTVKWTLLPFCEMRQTFTVLAPRVPALQVPGGRAFGYAKQ